MLDLPATETPTPTFTHRDYELAKVALEAVQLARVCASKESVQIIRERDGDWRVIITIKEGGPS